MRSVSSPRAVSMMIGTWRRRSLAAQAPADLDPGYAFDHPVEDDEIGRSLLREKKRLFPVRGADDLIAFALEMP